MGLSTKVIINPKTKLSEIITFLETKFKTKVELREAASGMFSLMFTINLDKSGTKEQRVLYVFMDRTTCRYDFEIDGILISFNCWGMFKSIADSLCNEFGGMVDYNDCDDEGFITICPEKFFNSEAPENKELDSVLHEIILAFGNDKVNKFIELSNKYQNVK
ncbi:gp221 [Sphingomonas phage PAU]|uniref:gp221 n=1 Tax=Sphingomonas phage PAU TaxID=1150991 RepID=UPI000257337B|nr:gp221 [Sphingomonas phage PAU]AFF28219.1 gp221 [Sphingomonas phage PAU]